MDSTLVAGLMSAVATLAAAAIGAYTLLRSNKQNEARRRAQNEEPTLPFKLHRAELEQKEREVRELIKIAVLYRTQARISAKHGAEAQKYYNNLVDFFEGITDESKLELEVAVKDDGTMAIFCNKELKVQLMCVEVFLGEKGCIFVEATGARRPVGLPLPDEVIAPLAAHKPTTFLLVIVGTDRKPVRAWYFPLRVYDPHPAGLPVPNSERLPDDA